MASSAVQMETMPIDRNKTRLENEHETYPPPPFGYWDMGFIIFGIVSYIADQVSDIWVAVLYFRRGWPRDKWYFALTMTFVLVPSLITMCFSLKWYIEDVKSQRKATQSTALMKWIFRGLFHFIQLSQVWRYLETFKIGLQSRRLKENAHDFRVLLSYEDSDASLLRLFEAFIESGPQMVLLIYILSKGAQLSSGFPESLAATSQGVSLVLSLISMAWALSSYQRCLRFSIDSKKNLSWPASIAQFVWHAGTLWSRVMSLALFASVFPLYFLIICLVHWIFMTVWIITMKTDFCQHKCEEILYNTVIGIVYIFCYFNVKDEPTRYKYIIYYLVTFAESTSMIVAWYVYVDVFEWYHDPALISFFTSFGLGIIFMLMFYTFLHPSIEACGKTEISVLNRTPPSVTATALEIEELDPSKLSSLGEPNVPDLENPRKQYDVTDGPKYNAHPVYYKWGRN